MVLLTPFTYVDPSGVSWTAPAGMETDGASIPPYFWILGIAPYNGKFREPAVIHDWYCDHRVRPYKDTHRMFFHAMLANGVARREAQALYVAVLIGGPKWDDQAIYNEKLAEELAKKQGVKLLPPPKVATTSRRGNVSGFSVRTDYFVDVPPGREDDPEWLPDGPIAQSAAIWDKATIKQTSTLLKPEKVDPEKVQAAITRARASDMSVSEIENLAESVKPNVAAK